MLKIKNIKYGMIPTGPALGMTSLQVFFEDIEGEYELDEYDLGKKWEQNKETKIITEVPRELFLEFLNVIQEKNLQKEYETATNSLQSCFILFMGDTIDDPRNFKEFNRFHIDLSNRSWNYQISIGVEINKMRPPYSIFAGIPKFMTGKNQFYELFNTIYPLLKFTQEPTNYNILALQECFNGPFTLATIFFDNGKIEDILTLKDQFKIPNHKVAVIDIKSSNLEGKSLEEFILSNNCRYFPYLKGRNFIKLI